MNPVALLTSALERLGLIVDHGAWIDEKRLLVCADPTSDKALSTLARDRGIALLINLRERAQDPGRLARFGLAELHLPVADKAAPSPAQLARGLAAIARSVGDGQRVAIHCRNGRGRSGVLAACHLIAHHRLSADEAIARVRAARPGAIETAEQEAAIRACAEALAQRPAATS